MNKVLIFTGAGLSAESGIAIFRGKDGLWDKHKIEDVCTKGCLDGKNRQKVIDFYDERREELKDKQPNKAHKTIAYLQKKYPNQIYNITQNVDNLLEKSGCENVIHLHGELTKVICTNESCKTIQDIGYKKQKCACSVCGVNLRPFVVMFYEDAPQYKLLNEAIKDTTMFVSIGTSGKVIDIVKINKNYQHSILINPNRELYYDEENPSRHKVYTDEEFEYFFQIEATKAVDRFLPVIEKHLQEKY